MSKPVRDCFFVFGIVHLLGSFWACQSTASSPRTAGLKSDDLYQAGDTSRQDVKLGVFKSIVATRLAPQGPDATEAWTVVMKTDPEFWCERRCSTFELVEARGEGRRVITVKKTTVVGHTTPGFLAKEKTYTAGEGVGAAALEFVNVGQIGSRLFLQDILRPGQDNFYAVEMLLSRRREGGQTHWSGSIGDQSYELRWSERVSIPDDLMNASEPKTAFVMGSLTKGAGSAQNSIFEVIQILPDTQD
jgi:hypothetical protein